MYVCLCSAGDDGKKRDGKGAADEGPIHTGALYGLHAARLLGGKGNSRGQCRLDISHGHLSTARSVVVTFTHSDTGTTR